MGGLTSEGLASALCRDAPSWEAGGLTARPTGRMGRLPNKCLLPHVLGPWFLPIHRPSLGAGSGPWTSYSPMLPAASRTATVCETGPAPGARDAASVHPSLPLEEASSSLFE